MPPKKNPNEITLSDIAASIQTLNKKMDVLNQKFDKQGSDISSIKTHLNSIEQNQRSHSIRVFNLEVDFATNNTSVLLANFLYDNWLGPILDTAINEKFISSKPGPLDLIDTCHPLPALPDKVPAILVRLRSKILKEALMRHKKLFFSSLDDSSKLPTIVDDITKMNAMLLKSTKERVDVESAWYFNGKIRYKLKSDSKNIHTAKP